MHIVDIAYNTTREAWQAYQEASTPWPSDWPTRCKLMGQRVAVFQERLTIISQAPQDKRTAMEARVYAHAIASDLATIAKHS